MSDKRFWVGLLAVGWTLGSWAQCDGAVQASDWRARFVEPVIQTLQVAWDGLVDFRAHDFDGDGATDLVFADRRGLWVCWGTAGHGLDEAYNLMGQRVDIDQIAFEQANHHEAYPPLLWIKMATGSGSYEVRAFAFNGRDLVPFRDLSTTIRGSLRCTGNGLIVGEDGEGHLLLERHGAMLNLGRLAGHVEDLDFVDLNADGWEDAIVQQAQRLKVALGQPTGGLGPWMELGSAEVQSWDVAVDLDGAVVIFAQTADMTSYRCWFIDGDVPVAVPMERNGRSRIINHHSAQMDGTVLLHNPVVSTLSVVAFRRTGEMYGNQPVAELEPNSLFQLSDWDGDGDEDVVVLHEGNRTLTWVPYVGGGDVAEPRWSRDVLQTLVDSVRAEFTGQLNTSNQWRRDVDWSTDISEWAVASSGIWGVGEAEAFRSVWCPSELDEVKRLEKLNPEPCVDIRYLVFDERLDPCLKMDMDREWHRLTYSRDALGRTFVVIDGALRFDGITEGLRFDHRMLHLGGAFGTSWFSYASVSLDEVAVFRGSAMPEELLDWQQSDEMPSDLERAVAFDFEGGHPEMPLDGGQVLNIDAGAEVVRAEGRGHALVFDGLTGRAQSFADIPEREVVFDLRFKMNREVDERQTLASLYGMYTLLFNVRMGRPQPGVVRSPADFKQLRSGDSRGGYLMTYRGGIMRMLPSGEWLVPNPEGWDLMESKALPFGWARSAPWVQDGVAYAVFGNKGRIWRCLGPELGWEEHAQLDRSLTAVEGVVSTGQWALMWTDDRSTFGWLDVEQGAFYRQNTASLPEEVQAVRPGRGGVEFMDARGKWWLIEPPSRESERVAAFRSGSPWLWGMTAFACASAAGFLALRWRRRGGAMTANDDVEIDATVAHTLNQLKPRAGEIIDADELDALLGIESIDTPETRRSRRNRAVNELNAWSVQSRGHAWVKRNRDSQDRRRALYELSGDMKDCCNELKEGAKDVV